MKKLCVLLILVAVAMAVNTKTAKNEYLLAPPEDKIDINRPALRISSNNAPAENMPILGRQEVIGWTDYDWQANGPTYSLCRLDPIADGIHVCWMYRLGTDPRNMRYNFYDFTATPPAWVFPGTGENVFIPFTGYGGMDYIPTGLYAGCAVISAHYTATAGLTPKIARDISPGAGLFEYCDANANYLWAPVAVTNNQTIHLAAVCNSAVRDSVYYLRMTPWNTWATPYLIHDATAVPNSPNQNIAASKTSNKVAIVWMCADDPIPKRAFYRLSTDGGVNWGAQTSIPNPPSTGFTPWYWVSALYPMFDNSDNLRIAVSVGAMASESTYYLSPAEIWLYSPANTSPWTLVQHYEPDTLTGEPASNGFIVARATVAQATGVNGNFYVAWEQFDSLNVEPTSGFLRADIWVAELTNNGQTVSRKGKITDPDLTDKRYPAIGGVKNDTVILMYMIDSIAGSYIQGQGALTVNPMIVHRFHKNSLPVAIEEGNPTPKIYNFALSSATPNPSNITTKISYSLPTTSNVHLTIYDVLGRPIRTLVSGTKAPGEYSTIWDGRTNTGSKVQNGIYFYTLKTADKSISRKLIRTY